jgi:hypothetical protein
MTKVVPSRLSNRTRTRTRYRSLVVASEKRAGESRTITITITSTIKERVLTALAPDLALTLDHVLVAGQFFQTHRPAGVQPICTDSDLSSKTKLCTVI